eukprot:TRINITY_DN6953_c0_g1_i1.p1 TRINITY_DN6953_c0_g1~~TRINITY_DN6953_c0_g1_i1.p1  ORF type:complete len:299 (-),score=85.58 TRINITY_DN6953_c0_g1_i1:26-802(-)
MTEVATETLLPPELNPLAASVVPQLQMPVPAAVCPRCATLSAENAQLKLELEQWKKKAQENIKRKKAASDDSDAEFEPEATTPKKAKLAGLPGTPAAAKPAKAAKPLKADKFWKKWAKAVDRKAKSAKFHNEFLSGCTGEIVVDETITPEVYHQLFDGKGTLIQPRPDNKPGSVLHISRFDTWEAVEGLFGKGNIERGGHMAWVWQKGGVASRWGGGFSKACKMYQGPASIDRLEVQYNRTKMSLELKFACSMDGGDC